MLAELKEKLGFGDDEDEALRARVEAKCTTAFCRQVLNSVQKQKRPAAKGGKGCWICEDEFMLLIKPERICGCCSQSVCGACSRSEMHLPCFTLDEPLRICAVCARALAQCPTEEIEKPNRKQLRERGDPQQGGDRAVSPEREPEGFRSILGLGAVAELEIRAAAPVDPAEREVYFAQLMNSRRAMERDGLHEVPPGESSDGGVYVIDQHWFQQWEAFTDDEAPPPGPITNQRLVIGATDQPHGGLRPKHYRCVKASTWNLLFSRYGGGPAIRRPRADIYS